MVSNRCRRLERQADVREMLSMVALWTHAIGLESLLPVLYIVTGGARRIPVRIDGAVGSNVNRPSSLARRPWR